QADDRQRPRPPARRVEAHEAPELVEEMEDPRDDPLDGVQDRVKGTHEGCLLEVFRRVVRRRPTGGYTEGTCPCGTPGPGHRLVELRDVVHPAVAPRV